MNKNELEFTFKGFIKARWKPLLFKIFVTLPFYLHINSHGAVYVALLVMLTVSMLSIETSEHLSNLQIKLEKEYSKSLNNHAIGLIKELVNEINYPTFSEEHKKKLFGYVRELEASARK